MSTKNPPFLIRSIPWLAVVLVAILILLARVVLYSRSELETGLAASERGERQAAIVHLDRAAHWYTPFNPYVTAALTELRQLGRQSEIEGQVDIALSAYRAIRSSCLGTRSFYTPHRNQLEHANQRIAALMARQPPPLMDRGKTVTQLREEHLELLEYVNEPHPAWSLLAGLSFLLWIGGALGFIFKGLDKELRPKGRPAMIWVGVVAGGLILWALSLHMA